MPPPETITIRLLLLLARAEFMSQFVANMGRIFNLRAF